MDIDPEDRIHISPWPLKITDHIEIGAGCALSGTPSNYMKLLIEQWTEQPAL